MLTKPSIDQILSTILLILLGGGFAILKKWRHEEIDFPITKKMRVLLFTILLGGFSGAFFLNIFTAITVGYSMSLLESFVRLLMFWNLAAISSTIGLTTFPTKRKKLFGVLYAVLLGGFSAILFTAMFEKGSLVRRFDQSFFVFIITAISVPPTGFINGWLLERLEKQSIEDIKISSND